MVVELAGTELAGWILLGQTNGEGQGGWASYPFHGNELWRFLVLLGLILATLAAGRIVKYVIERSAQRVRQREKVVLAELFLRCLARPVAVGVFAVGVYLGRLTMRFASEVDPAGFARQTYDLWGKVGQALVAVSAAYFIFRLVDVVEHYLRQWTSRTETKLDDMLVPVIRKSLRIFVTVVSVLFIGDNILELELGTVLAAAGVGGLAVALAAQETIANFFGSINIFADRPFQVNELIKIGDHYGAVEEVGFRSTRIRTLEGHLVTIPNNTIANSPLENVGRRPFIRRTSNITITYDSGSGKTKKAVEIIKKVLEEVPEVNADEGHPPRVYFSDFNDWSLNIYMSYWVKPAEFWVYQQVNERVNLEIMKRFEAEKIEFAFPTQTLYVKKD